MQISKIALLMALTANSAIAAPLQGSETALEQRGVDVKPAITELNARDVHDEDVLLTRRSSSKWENWHQKSDKQKGIYTIHESSREHTDRLERQGGGRQYGMVEKPKGKGYQHPTSGTQNKPSRAETEKEKKKQKYGKNGR